MTRHKQIAQVLSKDELRTLKFGLNSLKTDSYWNCESTDKLHYLLDKASKYQEIFKEVQEKNLGSVMGNQVLEILLEREGLKDD